MLYDLCTGEGEDKQTVLRPKELICQQIAFLKHGEMLFVDIPYPFFPTGSGEFNQQPLNPSCLNICCIVD